MKLSDRELKIIKESLECRKTEPDIDKLLQRVKEEISDRDYFFNAIMRMAGLEET